MIKKEELIKHKWKYNEFQNHWEKLGVIICDTPFDFGYHVRYPVNLITYIATESVEVLEDYIKCDIKNHVLNPVFGKNLTHRAKRTLKNWIL